MMKIKYQVGMLNYTLRPVYYIDRNVYFERLYKNCTNVSHKPYLITGKINFEEDFAGRIKSEKIINNYYEEAKNKLEKGTTINILENGLFNYDNKLLLYCIKDEETEDNYINNIDNISCIKHEEYDKAVYNLKYNIKSNKDNTNNVNNNVIKTIDKDNKSFKSSSKSDNESMTGIKNRAIALESFVDFFFRQFNVLPLPDLVLNLDYSRKGKKIEGKINLYFEWDGCYLLEEKEKDIVFAKDSILPFNKELNYKLNKYGEPELINNNILIERKTIAFIEVKSHFPKEEEENSKDNLENIIKMMFYKLNYFVKIFTKILQEKVENIKIILLYNQNRLTNYYQNNIKKYIKIYSKNFDSLNKYKIYFDILYIIPSIGKLSLNRISEKLSETNQQLCETNKQLLETNQQLYDTNEKIKKLEEDNKKIKKLEEDNKKIKKLEEDNKISNQKIKELERELSLIKSQIQNEEIKDSEISVKRDFIKEKEDDSSNINKNAKKESEKLQNIQKKYEITPGNNEKKTKIYSNLIKNAETIPSKEKTKKINTPKTTPKKSENNNVNSKSIILSKEKSGENTNIIKNITVVGNSSNQMGPKQNEIKKEKCDKNESNKNNNGNNGKNKPNEKEPKKIDLKSEKSNQDKTKIPNKEEKELSNKSVTSNNETLNDKIKKDESNKMNLKNLQEKKESKAIKDKESQPNKNLNETNSSKKKENMSQKEKEKNININKKSEIAPKNIYANTKIEYIDEIYDRIVSKIKNNKTLLDKERIYLSIYNQCKNELKENNFSLIGLKNNHTGGENQKYANAFHSALKSLKKEERNLFFEKYRFLPCMLECDKLIDYQ